VSALFQSTVYFPFFRNDHHSLLNIRAGAREAEGALVAVPSEPDEGVGIAVAEHDKSVK
jgi:hypothetical protein